MKKAILGLVLLALSSGIAVQASTAWDRGYTLIVAPARYSVIQLMFDVIDQRPAVLVAYQMNPADPADVVLHTWNGREWLGLDPADFQSLRFVLSPPTRTVLIGSLALVPPSVGQAVESMPNPLVIRDVTNPGILNGLDRAFSWRRAEWRWFTARYNLDLEDEAAALRNESWFDQPGPIVRDPDLNPIQGAAIRARGQAAPPAQFESRDLPAAPVVDRPGH
ncbi:MAG TPA: hypothetical protein PKE55_10570 [Kiritimatiellia bacterium]|nr:hypothetical protein [Kiritimatiellia bacterium]